jgi:hypothetical protein
MTLLKERKIQKKRSYFRFYIKPKLRIGKADEQTSLIDLDGCSV